MASAGKVDVSVAVKPKVGVGPSTIAGGTVTVAAYAVAVLAYIQGARDEATVSAIVVGTVSLVTVLSGRYAQAVAALLKRSSWGAAKPPAPTMYLGSSGNVGTGTGVASTYTTGFAAGGHLSNPEPEADEDGPGDELHEIFADETPADPAEIPRDKGEGPAARTVPPIATASRVSSAVSRLTVAERARAREMVMQAAYLGLKHAPALHYTQGAKRWEGIAKHLRAWRGQYPAYADCSAFATWCLWQGLGHFHVGDVVNGENWQAGWTGTQLEHGKRVVHEANVKQGDLALYNGHVAVCVGGGMVISHGSEGGPYLLPLHYRSDLVAIRRYI